MINNLYFSVNIIRKPAVRMNMQCLIMPAHSTRIPSEEARLPQLIRMR